MLRWIFSKLKKIFGHRYPVKIPTLVKDGIIYYYYPTGVVQEILCSKPLFVRKYRIRSSYIPSDLEPRDYTTFYPVFPPLDQLCKEEYHLYLLWEKEKERETFWVYVHKEYSDEEGKNRHIEGNSWNAYGKLGELIQKYEIREVGEMECVVSHSFIGRRWQSPREVEKKKYEITSWWDFSWRVYDFVRLVNNPEDEIEKLLNDEYLRKIFLSKGGTGEYFILPECLTASGRALYYGGYSRQIPHGGEKRLRVKMSIEFQHFLEALKELLISYGYKDIPAALEKILEKPNIYALAYYQKYYENFWKKRWSWIKVEKEEEEEVNKILGRA